MEDLKIEIQAAKRNLMIMQQNLGVVTLDGNIEAVQEWLNAYAYLEQHIDIALQFIEQEEKGT